MFRIRGPAGAGHDIAVNRRVWPLDARRRAVLRCSRDAEVFKRMPKIFERRPPDVSSGPPEGGRRNPRGHGPAVSVVHLGGTGAIGSAQRVGPLSRVRETRGPARRPPSPQAPPPPVTARDAVAHRAAVTAFPASPPGRRRPRVRFGIASMYHESSPAPATSAPRPAHGRGLPVTVPRPSTVRPDGRGVRVRPRPSPSTAARRRSRPGPALGDGRHGAGQRTITNSEYAPSCRPVTWPVGVRHLRRRHAVPAAQTPPGAAGALPLVKAHRRAVPASAELALAAR